jgi:hypothetical protein
MLLMRVRLVARQPVLVRHGQLHGSQCRTHLVGHGTDPTHSTPKQWRSTGHAATRFGPAHRACFTRFGSLVEPKRVTTSVLVSHSRCERTDRSRAGALGVKVGGGTSREVSESEQGRKIPCHPAQLLAGFEREHCVR